MELLKVLLILSLISVFPGYIDNGQKIRNTTNCKVKVKHAPEYIIADRFYGSKDSALLIIHIGVTLKLTPSWAN